MARNAAGNYTLPSGNPVITGATIQSSWANTTLSDLASEITDSLSRTGKGGMLSALLLVNGTISAPAMAFASEVSSGLYRAAANDMRLVLGGVDRLRVLSATGGNPSLVFRSPQAGSGTATDFVFETSITRTAGALFGLSNNGVERFRIDYNGDIYKNGALFDPGTPSVNPWSSYFLAADATVTATASDLTGMSFAMEANSKYVVRAILVGLSGDAADFGVTFRMKGSGAPTIDSMKIMTLQDTTGGAMQTQEATGVDADWVNGTTSPSEGQGSIRISYGVIYTGGSAGTFQLQGRRTGGTADPAIRAGSYIEYHKI
jgi:hypothetical protein